MKYLLFSILVLSAAASEPVDKAIREDWSKGKIQEVSGKKVLTPALIYVFIGADGSETVVTEKVWTEKYFKN